ncbi:hypothetical protein DOTSEDRAFT_40632 [Dothistroma septosporum NZE10]|uniref:Uncharacterized protein n=1 Tax=Dothistroma septosporum (strain NZE10 / CBS 128990) TaxID=675120 RepID=N1Q172_DOTSN|nr:hypothetical protein DOTSEDRAFT_40632 [Dothistroma septosporum NZE10]
MPMPMPPSTLNLMAAEPFGLHRRTQPEQMSRHLESVAAPESVTHVTAPVVAQLTTHQPTSRPTRHRVTSHYSVFQTSCTPSIDTPPTYASASRPRAVRSQTEGAEPLPNYSCTVDAEAKLLLSLESINPLSPIGEGEWREVYVVLRGTLLSVHKSKDGGAGKLLRTYTLQHAEVGLAPDAQHTVLVPQSRLAHLIPHSARWRAWQKDLALFRPVRQTIMRLRAETDQIILADSDEERIHAFTHALAAAIDVSQPIDDRNIPRQCTVPRRRRRQQRAQFNGADLSDPALIAEQERILSHVAPRFAITNVLGQDVAREGVIPDVVETPQTPAREEEEIDLSTMREEVFETAINAPSRGRATRPSNNRQTTSTTINSTFSEDMIYASSATNFTDDGKWLPPHHRSAAQIQRYIKRCMPVLLGDSQRASDIIIADGKRLRINWRMEMLEEWELQPPSYKSHDFRKETGLARSSSHRSSNGSMSNAGQFSSSSILAAEDDQIHQIDQCLDNFQLSKVMSATTTNKRDRNSVPAEPKGQATQQLAQEIHGVVICF